MKEKRSNPAKKLIAQIKRDLKKVDEFFKRCHLDEKKEFKAKAGKIKTKGFKFNREEANERK
jgi:hypothetical protein